MLSINFLYLLKKFFAHRGKPTKARSGAKKDYKDY